MPRHLLLVRAGNRVCGLSVEHVDETMRPLPLETLPDVPEFVRGTSLVRGDATPVVDLRSLLGEDALAEPQRMVTIRPDDTRRAGLLVDDVLGVTDADVLGSQDLPPLLRGASRRIVDQLAELDGRLLTVLKAGSLVPEDVWLQVTKGERTF